MTTKERKKKALLFGGTDGHGITMTAISEKNLRREKYAVTTVCRFEKDLPTTKNLKKTDLPEDCGTGSPEFFWGRTFLNWDYSGLNDSDLIVVVDIPLPIRQRLDFSAADEAIEKIGELTWRGIRVVLIDHHKRAITHYGKSIENDAELVFTIGAEQYCHYGKPNDHALFWGARGAICDRDPSMLPVEEDEFAPFQMIEQDASWLDLEKKNNESLLDRILCDNRIIPNVSEEATKPKEYPFNKKVSFVKRLAPLGGFKQLDVACAANKTLYGVGVTHDCTAIQVINYWKIPSLPLALQLPQYRDTVGHDSALVIPLDSSDCTAAEQRMNEICDLLNSEKMENPESFSDEADAIGYISRVFKEVIFPMKLTNHGWNHVETVLANARLLGSISNLTDYQQKILNWSALFHDIGNAAMAYKTEYGYPLDVKDYDEAREKHQEYTVQILKHWYQQGLFKDLIPKEDLSKICTLCKHHRKISGMPDDRKLWTLCSLLRIADALDKTKSRARRHDDGTPYSKIKDKLPIDSIPHWEGQRAIDSIRLYLSRNQIKFEFLVTDRKSANFIINDFKAELKPLKGIIPEWKVIRIPVPRKVS